MEVGGLFACFSSVMYLTVHQRRSKSSSRVSSYTSQYHLFYVSLVLTLSHRLLGLSAFAGFLILLAGWPLNSFIARRSIRIQKGVLSARDKRMGVLNELIGAVSVSCPSDHLLRAV